MRLPLPPKRFFAGLVLPVLVLACESGSSKSASKKTKATPGEQAKPAALQDEKSNSAQPKGPAGVVPIASAPREHWPCKKTVDTVGAVVTYDYSGAPERCWFPPDLWQPGCPTRHVQGNPKMGIEIEVRYRYDEKSRLAAISSKLHMASVESITYKDDKVVAQDVWTYHPAGDATHMWHKDGSFYASVHHRKGVGIARLQTGADMPGAEPSTDERFEYEGDRLLRIRGKALGMTETHQFEYDCK